MNRLTRLLALIGSIMPEAMRPSLFRNDDPRPKKFRHRGRNPNHRPRMKARYGNGGYNLHKFK
jgi:hypothetical protein